MHDNPLIRLNDYELRHLTLHLAQAERAKELHSLLQIETATGGNAWFEAKKAAGDTFSVAADVELAWTVATSPKPSASAIPIVDQSNELSLSLRYALYTTSLNALDHNHYPGLIFLLVHYGIWNVKQALASISYAKDAWNQAALLRRLLPLLPDSLLAQVLSLARSIDFYHCRAEVLASVASRLPQPERDAVVEEAFQVATSRGPDSLVNDTLTTLAPLLPDKMLEEAIEFAQNLKHIFSRALLLIVLVRQLRPANRRTHLKQILALVHAQERMDQRVVALARLSSCMSPRERVKTLDQAVALALSVSTPKEQAAACAELLPHLPKRLKRSVVVALLHAVRQSFLQTALPETGPQEWSQPESWILEGLRACAKELCHLGAEEQDEAISLVRRIEHKLQRARLLAEFALPAKKSSQSDCFLEALRIMEEVPNDSYQAVVWRCYGASRQAKELSDDQLLVILGAREFTDPDRWLREVTIILDSLREDRKIRLLKDAFANSRRIKDEEERVKVLFPLLPALNDNQLTEAQLMVESCRSKLLRAQLLTAVCRRVPKTTAAMIRQQVLAIANEDELIRENVLALIVPHLTESELRQLFKSILTIEFPSSRAEALARTALYLPETLQVRAVEALCLVVTEERQGSKWLAALALHLPKRLKDQALRTVIDTVIEAPWESESLVQLSSELPEDLIVQVCEIAMRVQDRDLRDELFWALALRSVELGEVDRGLTWVHQIKHHRSRFDALKNICSGLVLLDRTSEALDILENREDHDRLSLLCQIAEAAKEPLAKENAERIVRIARDIEDEGTRAEALAAVLPLLPRSLRRKMLEQTLTLLFATHRVAHVVGLLEQLKQNRPALTIRISSALQVAIDNIRQLADPYRRLIGLAATHRLLHAGVDQDLRQALSELFQQCDPQRPQPHRIIDLIPTLVPCMSEDLREILLNFAWDSTQGYASGEVRDATLAYLAKTLCNAGLPANGLEIASSITDTNPRAKALNAISQCLAESIAPVTIQGFHRNLRKLAQRNRNEFCSDLSTLCPTIKTLGGETCLADTFDALRCVTRWWP